MEATCPISNKKFTISAAETKYCQDRSIPLPQMHPHERMRRILSFRNRTFLYNETCALTKKNILSQIPPGRGFTVYETDAWNSDQWDAMAYGQDYDPTRSFFDQISELLKKVPLPNLTVVKASLENSDYCNGAVNLKNCYLCFASVNSSDCMFCWNAAGCKDVVDCISPLESELCYNCLDIDHCYRLYYSQACNYCSESYFLEGCQSSKNCFGCVNLTNKQYCWYNEQLTKEQYEERIGQLNLGNWDVVESELRKFNDFKKQFPRKSLQGRNNETVSGNYLHNCKDCKNLFHSDGSIDVENSIGTNKCKDSFCSAFNRDGELVYNTQAGVGNYNNQFCAECVQTRDLMYCLYCVQGTSDCLGCVSLKKKQYCILNKQYSKEEYEKLAAQIKKQLTEECAWEEFFPAKLSPIYYNESDGMIILPLTREEALNRGFAWKDDQGEKAAPTNIAKTISDVDDSVLQSTYTCEKTGKKYRIVKPELDFYRKMNIPLPHIAPLPRVHQLASIFRITDLLLVKCGHCQNDIETGYDPNERKVLCEECYLQTTY